MDKSRLTISAILILVFSLAFTLIAQFQAPGRLVSARLSSAPDYTLNDFIADLKASIPRAGSEAFIEPSQEERQAFALTVERLLAGAPAEEVAEMAAPLNYDLVLLEDEGFAQSYLILVERQKGFRGLGTYIVNPSYWRNLVLEVPHPLFDIGTLEESARILQETGARALFVTGTHRCANDAITPCTQGTTTACGGIYRVSDVAHYTENFFQAAHQASLQVSDPPVAISVHGNSSPSARDVVLSDGTTRRAADTALVNQLRNALVNREVSVASCNFGDSGTGSLCGTDNVQGRLSNNSAEPCTESGPSASGLFLHLEQHRNIRDDPTQVIAAIQEVFPSLR